MPHVDDDANLDPKVEGNEIDDKGKEGFDNGKATKDHPVRQPLRVIVIPRVHGLETHVGWIHKTNEIHNQFGTTNDP